MATKAVKKSKQSKRRTVASKKPTIAIPQELPSFSKTSPMNLWKPSWKISKTGLVALILGVVILVLLALNKGLLVAAVVNNKPILRSSVNKTLLARYGTETLENMITERLIEDEAKRLKITVTQQEITDQQEAILASFGGNVTLEEVLKYQGMTKEDFDQQIRLQLFLTKLVGKDIVISDDEVATYIANNASTLVATESEGMKKEAKDAILMQKVGENLQTWYSALKEKAKIYRFIK